MTEIINFPYEKTAAGRMEKSSKFHSLSHLPFLQNTSFVSRNIGSINFQVTTTTSNEKIDPRVSDLLRALSLKSKGNLTNSEINDLIILSLSELLQIISEKEKDSNV
jgi:hypothetical protein